MSRDPLLFVEDMLRSARRVVAYTRHLSIEGFTADAKTQDAVIRNLEVLGEASKQVPQNIRELLPTVPWRRLAGLRDVLAHDYFGVDLEIVWDIVATQIPPLIQALDPLVGDTDRDSG